MDREEAFLQIFPPGMKEQMKLLAKKTDQLQEVRLRTEGPVLCLWRGNEFFYHPQKGLLKQEQGCMYIARAQIGQILNHISRNSLYAYTEQMSQGFFTMPDGSRIGMAGQVILERDGSIRSLKAVSSLNIRLAHQVKGAADSILPFLYENGQVCHTLLVSPPGCGKTTLLRDLIRQISNGNAYGAGRTVGVVDERSEIGGCYQGKPQNDLGIRTDLLDACPKALGMMLLLRSMAPAVIAVDELGSREDMKALEQVMQCGLSVIATIHGKDREDLFTKPFLQPFLQHHIFERYFFLKREKDRYVISQMLGKDLRPWCA